MRKTIILIDDKQPSQATVAYWIGQEIEELTNGEYCVALLEGVIIANALPLVKKLAEEIHQKGDSLVGLLIDLVDETRGVKDAGAILLDTVKSDPELKKIPVVLYSKRQLIVSVADLRGRGAKAFVRRAIIGGKAGDLGKQILDAFDIQY